MSNKIDWEEIYTKDQLFYSKKDDKLLNGTLTTFLNVSYSEMEVKEGTTTINFKDGIIHGDYQVTNPDNESVVLVEGVIENNNGHLKEYKPNGTLKSEGEYEVRVWEYGPFKSVRKLEDGTEEEIKEKNRLFTFFLSGDHLLYNEEKDLKKKTEHITLYLEDVLKITHYYEGKILRIETVRESDLYQHGLTKFFFDNGKVKSETNYKYDMFHGFSRKFYENGSLKEEGTYIDGKKDGKWTTYYKRSLLSEPMKVKERGHYIHGFRYSVGFGKTKTSVKHGVWEYFNKDGTLTRKENWVNGNLDGKQFEVLEDGSHYYPIYRNNRFIGEDNTFTRLKYILGLLMYSNFFDD